MMMSGMGSAAGVQQRAAAQDSNQGKMIDLIDCIAKSECYARNEDPRYPITNLFTEDSRLGCKSDTDEQLIIHISFQFFVKLHSLKFTEFDRGSDPESNPSLVKLFVNRTNLGFEDVEDVEETQTLELTADDLRAGGNSILLKFVKFQRVSSLTIFIEDNSGGDVSALGEVKFFGKKVATTNMSDFKKQG